MQQPKGWIPFLLSKDEFLWFCLTCRESGVRASERLEIADKVVAWDLENAVTYRLLKFDNEKQKQMAKMIAYEVSKIFGDGSDDDSVLNATELHPLVRNDPYADENTQIS